MTPVPTMKPVVAVIFTVLHPTSCLSMGCDLGKDLTEAQVVEALQGKTLAGGLVMAIGKGTSASTHAPTHLPTALPTAAPDEKKGMGAGGIIVIILVVVVVIGLIGVAAVTMRKRSQHTAGLRSDVDL